MNFADLDTDPNASAPRAEGVDTDRVHIANGGNRVEMVSCPKCNGSGMTRWGACFSCQGKGKRSTRSIAASKASATRRANDAERREEFFRNNAEAIEFVARNSDWSDFYRSMNQAITDYGFLTENQLAAVHRGMAKAAAKKEEKKAARVANAPTVEMSAIEALFATATNNDIKRPVFRADGIEISLAPANGRNAGSLYVKTNGEYAGKIASGKFQASFNAPSDTIDRLRLVAADPLAESIKYARKTGRCGCCGRELVDPVSIRAAIGPICAENWGLDWRRDIARDELASEKGGE